MAGHWLDTVGHGTTWLANYLDMAKTLPQVRRNENASPEFCAL